jgi:ATP-dependent Clp protease protease subunit
MKTRMQALLESFKAGAGKTRSFRADVSGDSAKLYLYDIIGQDWFGGVGPQDVVKALDAAGGKPLDIFINSPGGDVFDGVAIHSLLKRYGNTKTMHVDGLAASAASFLLMAGDTIVMAPAAQIMIHDAWAYSSGNAAELRATADLLDQTSKTLCDAYAARTKQDPKDVAAWMAAETWMTSDVALARGFCDAVEPGQDDDNDGDGAKARATKLLAELGARLKSSRASPQ